MNNTNLVVRASSNLGYSLSSAPYFVNIYIGTFLFIMGNIGCIGNVIVFQSKSFRKKAYVIYLFGETISDFFLINIVLLTRVLEKGFGIPIKNASDYLCKIRQFSTYYFYVTSFSLFTCATIDRVLSTQRSNALRKWSDRTRLAYKMVIILPLIWFLVLGHRLYVYKNENGDCGPQFPIYDMINNYFDAILMQILPLIIVFILAYLLRKSLRNVIERQSNMVNNPRQTDVKKRSQLQQMDSQLTLMLLLQSIIAVISFLPYGCQTIYDRVTETWYKTPVQTAVEKIIGQLTHVLVYTFFASSFHISFICNRGFRRQLLRTFQMHKVRPSFIGETAHAATMQ